MNKYHISRGHKLGLHCIRSSDATHGPSGLIAKAHAQGTPFPVVKAVTEGITALKTVRKKAPETYTIARVASRGFEGLEGLENVAVQDWREIHRRAQDLINLIKDWIDLQNPSDFDPAVYIDCWELCNEPDPPSAHGYKILGLVMKKAIEFGNEQLPGYDWGILSLNSGTPEWDEMQALIDSGVFDAAYESGNVLLMLHEGVFGDMPIDQGFGESLPGATIDPPENSGTLWFRAAWLAELLGDKMLPTVISEAYYEEWSRPEVAAERFQFIDEIAANFWWFFAALPYTVAPSAAWDHQNYEPAHLHALGYMSAIRNRVNAAAPAGDPDPPPPAPDPDCFGEPRLQYRCVRVLVPLTPHGITLAHAAIAATALEFGTTVCFSADDACVGAIEDKNLVIVNPDFWEDDIGQWVNDNYPRVKWKYLRAETPEQVRKNIAVVIRSIVNQPKPN